MYYNPSCLDSQDFGLTNVLPPSLSPPLMRLGQKLGIQGAEGQVFSLHAKEGILKLDNLFFQRAGAGLK